MFKPLLMAILTAALSVYSSASAQTQNEFPSDQGGGDPYVYYGEVDEVAWEPGDYDSPEFVIAPGVTYVKTSLGGGVVAIRFPQGARVDLPITQFGWRAKINFGPNTALTGTDLNRNGIPDWVERRELTIRPPENVQAH